MARLDREEIAKHIAILEEFERKYAEFLVARREAMTEGGNRWSETQWQSRRRELTALATRADAAMKASPVDFLVITLPPALGGGIKSADLPSQIFDFQDEFMGAGDGIQQQILRRIPSQIEGLRMEREKASEPRKRRKPPSERGGFLWWHEPNPWVLGIGSGLAVVGILALIAWLGGLL